MKLHALKETAEASNHDCGAGGEDYWTDVLRKSELRYRRLFESAQDGILILDADSGEIMDVNPFLIDLLDYPFEDLRGRKLWEIGQFKDIAANRAAFTKLQQTEYIRYENLPLRRKDGKEIQVEFVSNVYWVEEHKVIQCNIRDITVRAHQRHDSEEQRVALELANEAKDAWLIGQSENLRASLSEIGATLGLMELAHKLVNRRPASPGLSYFDQAALGHISANFRGIVQFFDALSDLTRQSRPQITSSLPPDAGSRYVASRASGHSRR